MCDLETSRMRRPWPALGRSDTGGRGNVCVCAYIYIYIYINSRNIQESFYIQELVQFVYGKLVYNSMRCSRVASDNRTQQAANHGFLVRQICSRYSSGNFGQQLYHVKLNKNPNAVTFVERDAK